MEQWLPQWGSGLLGAFQAGQSIAMQRKAAQQAAERQRFEMERAKAQQQQQQFDQERAQLEPEALEGYQQGRPQMLQVVNPQLYSQMQNEGNQREQLRLRGEELSNERARDTAKLQNEAAKQKQSTLASKQLFFANMIERNPQSLPQVLGALQRDGVDLAGASDPAQIVTQLRASAASVLGADKAANPDDEARQKAALGDDFALQVMNEEQIPWWDKRFGPAVAKRRAKAQALAAQKDATKKAAELPGIATDLRKEFQGQQVYKDTQAIATAYNKIQGASASGAGDIGLVFGYMKMLDPTSTVREGEFATAEQAGGVPGKIVSMYNRALSGERLSPEVRAEFKSEAERILNAQRQRYDASAGEFRRIAQGRGVNPDDVILDIGLPKARGAAQVPDQDRAQIVDAYRRRLNREPSPQEIEAAYSKKGAR